MHESAHCVTDSPFKNLNPQWYGEKYDPHCLTRFFEEDWFAHYLNPEALEETMSTMNYADFFLALEMGQHDIIPLGIRGDFTSFTAPNGRSLISTGFHCFTMFLLSFLLVSYHTLCNSINSFCYTQRDNESIFLLT